MNKGRGIMRDITTPESSWRNVEKVLKETFRLDDGRVEWLGRVRDELSRLASTGIPAAPDFTLHNEIHSDNVVVLLGELAKHLKSPLTEYESYLLVAAAYLHDVGMFFDVPRFEREILPDLAKSLRFCQKDKCDSGSRYEEELAGRPVDVQIRAVHHLLSAYLISEEGISLFSLLSTDRFHVMAICRGHRKANLCGQECPCYKTEPTKYGAVRRDLLAGLLRLADALDFYPERAPKEVFCNRVYSFLENSVALEHWLNHYFARIAYLTIGDWTGNPYLDCQLLYTVPAGTTLNGRSYEDFFTPLFDEFLNKARSTDFDISQYPHILLEVLGIRDIRVSKEVRAERGLDPLHHILVKEIEQSGCTDILQFFGYLELRRDRRTGVLEAQSVMDRRPEVRTFECILDGDDPQHRLMLMVGDHGQGKTWLMTTFESKVVKRRIPCLRLDLSGTIDFDGILDGIWRVLGPHRFPLYSAKRGRASRLEQRQALTECFFADWTAMQEPPRLVLLLDTYERAAPMLQDWIENSFLEGLQWIEPVILMIGGREWPRTSDYWSKHGYQFPLQGVQLRDYKEYAMQRGVPIPEAELIQLHQTMRGLPKLFAEHVDARAQMGGAE
jgi:hypothetical protein